MSREPQYTARTTVNLKPETDQALDEIIEKRQTTKSQLIREGIHMLIDKEEGRS